MGSIVNWWSDPMAGMHMSAVDWFLFFGLFAVSLTLWGIILSEIRGAE